MSFKELAFVTGDKRKVVKTHRHTITALKFTGIFSAILGRGPRAFLIGKISDIYREFGKFSKHSKLMIFSNLT